MSNQRFPLDWPQGYPRTVWRSNLNRPLFKTVSLTVAVRLIEDEIRKLKGLTHRAKIDIIISTDIPLRLDGYPRADYLRTGVKDPGAAVYFKHDRQDVVLCCDKWNTVENNLKAIAVTIEDMRRIERNGVSDFLKRSFQGFKQLPASRHWWDVLELEFMPVPEALNQWEIAKRNHKRLAMAHHPDRGGDGNKMAEINRAI